MSVLCEVVDLPIRILCIGGDEEPRIKLVESISLRGRYCTLSHRWGSQDKHPIQTTKANSSEYFIDIKFDSLPKVYQEAVTIARRLGFNYLWIDCLCIVQDDEEDWCREVEGMGPVYENSTLMIGAAGAKDPTHSCFSGVQETRNPLGQRAWAFQEWHLSRRRVFFTPKGMFWSCRENNLLNELGQGIFGPWTQILAAYTRKKLTRMSDRLVAVWGIATKYRETKKARYIAGIWEDDIAAQLLWQATKEPKPAENFNGVPSWSWAATIAVVPKTDLA
ncbi:heterokaryon incompatibility protein-domain-containing protein [Xylaria longipes]|nr:heterokaryon incompatibility protein-domain-containing protein [Xylaria longipes]